MRAAKKKKNTQNTKTYSRKYSTITQQSHNTHGSPVLVVEMKGKCVFYFCTHFPPCCNVVGVCRVTAAVVYRCGGEDERISVVSRGKGITKKED